jgi:hypothetical protein
MRLFFEPKKKSPKIFMISQQRSVIIISDGKNILRIFFISTQNNTQNHFDLILVIRERESRKSLRKFKSGREI